MGDLVTWTVQPSPFRHPVQAWREGPAFVGTLACDDRWQVERPEAAAEVLAPLLADLDREACYALHLDTKHRAIATELVSIGSIDHTFMSPREILRGALVSNASAIVLAHNHPSGDPEPSRDDEAVTRRVVQAGELVGVEVLDHLVMGDGGWVSLARRGVM